MVDEPDEPQDAVPHEERPDDNLPVEVVSGELVDDPAAEILEDLPGEVLSEEYLPDAPLSNELPSGGGGSTSTPALEAPPPQQRPRRLRSRVLMLIGVLVVLAAGGLAAAVLLGDDDNQDAGAPVVASPSVSVSISQSPAQVIRTYGEALLTDPAGACALQTAGFTQQLVEAGSFPSGTTCEDVVTAETAVLVGADDDRTLVVDAVEVIEEDADQARVRFTYSAGEPREYVLVRDGDGWLVAVRVETAPQASASASAAPRTVRWVENWCGLVKGQSRADAIRLMGPPTAEISSAGGASPQLEWTAGTYSFRANLDGEGNLTTFWANYDRLSAAERATLSCPAGR